MTCASGARPNDPAMHPNKGVRVTISAPPRNGDHQYNIITYLANLVGIEFGLRDNAAGPTVYWAVFRANNGGVISQNDGFKVVSPAPHTFEVSWLRGTRWGLFVDGKQMKSVDTGASESASMPGPTGLILTEFCQPLPQVVTFSDYQYLKDGVWRPVAHGNFYNSGGPAFPVAGNLQDPSIPPGGFNMGGSLPVIGAPTPLW